MTNTHSLTLFSFRRCPYAIRARMALYISGLSYEHIEVDLKNKPPEMLEISPSQTVPVLRIEEEEDAIDESLDIMIYALEQHDPEGWLDLTDLERRETFFLVEQNDDEFKGWLDRYKYFIRFPEQSQAYYRAKGEEILAHLDERINVNGYLINNRPTLADYAIFPFIRQWHNVDKTAIAPYTHLLKWLDKMLNLNVFIEVIKK